MKKFRQKGLSILLVILLVLYPVGGVFAQETTSDQTVESSPSPTPTPEPSPTTEPSPQPSEEPSPAPSTESSPTPSPSPSPTPPPPSSTFDPNYPDNHPPYSSPEYDEWKAQKEVWEQQGDVRDDEWEANEEDPDWVAAHGGDEQYYTSGQWETDQQAAAQNQQSSTTDNGTISMTSDPSATTSNCPGVTSLDGGGQSQDNVGSSDTGSGTSSAVSEDNDTTTVSNDNCADISNGSTASGTSGQNDQSSNDGDVSMTTGASSAEGRLENNANTNTTANDDDVAGSSASADESFASGSEAENLNTGEDSDNLAQASQSDTLTVDNDNEAYVDNSMTVEGTSGQNTVVDNDGSATLTTGDIELIANMLNILNLNITGDDFLHLIINIFGALTGDLDLDDIALYLGFEDDDALEDTIEVIARNDGPGDDSTNTAEASKEENTDITNNNSAEVNNEMNVTGVSGQNDVSGNDGATTIITGRIQILASLLNFINANFSGEKWSFIMVNIFGSLTGNIIVPSTEGYLNGQGGTVTAENTGAGGGSTSTSTATSTETTTISNDNNVDLSNSVSANGVTGANEQSNNDGPGTIQSGLVDISTQILNFLNMNIFGNNWVLLIVNVMGTWMGQIIGFGDFAISAPQEGTFAALQTGSAGSAPLENSTGGGGEDSTNVADASYVSNTNVQNSNMATVNNDMNLQGISGENTQNSNDGSPRLFTGWVEIDANILNIINMNITGRNWLVVFLNVFGDFMGNLVFGRENVPIASAATSQGDNSSQASQQDSSSGSSTSQNNQNQASVQSSTSASAQSGPGGDASASVKSTTRINTTSGQGNAGSNFEEESITVYVEVDTNPSPTPDNQPEDSLSSWFGGIKNWIFNLWQEISSSFNDLVTSIIGTVYGKGVN